MDASVAMISRGLDMSLTLTSLITQETPMPLHCVLGKLPGERDAALLDVLRRLGWEVSLHLAEAYEIGVPKARIEAAKHCPAHVVICMDDDMVFRPATALMQLAEAALEHSFAVPVIRFVSCFQRPDMPGHEEIWDTVSDDDQRVRRALEANGQGWRRVYEYGSDQPTDDLPGGFFATRAASYREAVKGLAGWRGGGEDTWLGFKLCSMEGPGIALSGVHAYHMGADDTVKKWGFDVTGLRLLRERPEMFRAFAAGGRR
jgi:hypothetical protein